VTATAKISHCKAAKRDRGIWGKIRKKRAPLYPVESENST
jgi:hypothetical protein